MEENTNPEDSKQSPDNIDSKEIKVSPFHISKYKKKSICVAIILLILISWFGIIDKKTEKYIDQTMVTALVAFGSARTINAADSLIKSADVSVMFLSASPGTILDPVDDMVEDFSTIMKISTASLVLQKIIRVWLFFIFLNFDCMSFYAVS